MAYPISGRTGYHSIMIGNKNTFNDWHLFSVNRPFVAPPLPKTRYVDVLGMSGSLDYTEAPNKIPKYADREGSWEFIMLNPGDVPEYSIADQGSYKYNWASRYSEIMAYLQGRRFDSIMLEDDWQYKYRGRVWVNEYRSDPGWGRIVLNYRLEPFKYLIGHRGWHADFVNRQISQNINVTFNLAQGLMPTPLTLHAGTDDADPSHYTHGCRVSFVNPELGIQTFWTFEKSIGEVGGITQYDVDHGIYMTYYDFDRYITKPECLVSNISGANECVLSLGKFNSDPTDWPYGPMQVIYQWEEAIL